MDTSDDPSGSPIADPRHQRGLALARGKGKKIRRGRGRHLAPTPSKRPSAARWATCAPAPAPAAGPRSRACCAWPRRRSRRPGRGRRAVSASLAFRVAQVAAVPVGDVASGAYPPAGACPRCGYADEDLDTLCELVSDVVKHPEQGRES